MLVYYSETKCLNQDDTQYASSGASMSCLYNGFCDIVFGNKFVIPKDATRIIIREQNDYLIERVFLRYRAFIYPIRTRIFHPSDVIVLTHVAGVNELSKISEPDKEVVFARDEALKEAIRCFWRDNDDAFYDISDRYDMITQGETCMSCLDNQGSRMRNSFISFTDNDAPGYINLDSCYDTYLPVFSNVSFSKDFNAYNDGSMYGLFNCAFDHCLNMFKENKNVDEFLYRWSKPVLPYDLSLDNFTLKCAYDILDKSDLRAYRDGSIRVINHSQVRQMTTFSPELLDWIRRLLQLPAVQMCFRYILPKWDYELIYTDTSNQKQFDDLFTDVIQRGSNIIKGVLPSGKFTDVVIDKTPNDMLIIRALGDNSYMLVVDLIIASALDDGFIRLDYSYRRL